MVNANSTVVNGIIKTDKGNVTFYGENFKFTFMNADTKEEIVLDVDENGYIWGRTYEGKVIAIYTVSFHTQLSNKKVKQIIEEVISE